MQLSRAATQRKKETRNNNTETQAGGRPVGCLEASGRKWLQSEGQGGIEDPSSSETTGKQLAQETCREALSLSK